MDLQWRFSVGENECHSFPRECSTKSTGCLSGDHHECSRLDCQQQCLADGIDPGEDYPTAAECAGAFGGQCDLCRAGFQQHASCVSMVQEQHAHTRANQLVLKYCQCQSRRRRYLLCGCDRCLELDPEQSGPV